MTMYNQTINSFLIKAASKSPTPGGGSIAALAAAMGASMGSMVANLSMGPKYEDCLEIMEVCVKNMNDIINSCEQVMLEDVDAFQSYMNALKLPKVTSEEKAIRSESIQAATIKSTEVPLKLMRLCNQSMDELIKVVNYANKNVISDLGIGAILMEAGAQSALLTVKMNLPVIKDHEFKHQVDQEAKQLSQDILAKKNIIEESVRSIMG